MDKRTCTQCGVQFQPKRKDSKHCSVQCRERSRRPTFEQPELFRCHGCGVFVCRPVRKRGQVPKWCAPCGGETSGSRQPWTMQCPHCKKAFETTDTRHRFCSRRCARREWDGLRHSTGVVHLGRKLRLRAEAQPPSRSIGTTFVAGACVRCGKSFVIAHQTESRYCSQACRRSDAKARRRARKRDAYVEDVSPTKVFERDAWRCQICGKLTARTKVVPHPKAPTLDHIIPLAAGGRHEPANAQCAHFACNSIKGDRSANDQLRLLG